eukprot:TRINITY_DN9975_c0_g1_i1.p2 TRINITY_DN9975_c0_g1~~TRINITY_DN9975_c0_g1_i1.p2  ORF type:complete len:167 (-),score=31.78 TRINITY_DN9975_c0_g1_i1:33-533(-)
MGLFFLLDEFKEFLGYFLILTSWVLFPTACSFENEKILGAFGGGFCIFAIFYEKILREEDVPLRIACNEVEEHTKRAYQRIEYWKGKSEGLMKFALILMVSVMADFLYVQQSVGYKCRFHSIYEAFSLKSIFFLLCLFYIYSWQIFYKTCYEDCLLYTSPSPRDRG